MSTVNDEIQRIINAKSAIKTSIENKNSDVLVGDGLINTYSDKIDLIDEWVAPADWIQLEEPNDNEILMLVADIVPQIAFTVRCVGGYSVDWGDGVVNNYTSGATATHVYSVGNGQVCSRGYTTYKLRIYAQNISNQITRYINARYNYSIITNSVLWVRMNTLSINYLQGAFTTSLSYFLERLELPISLINCTEYHYLCDGMFSLKSIRMPNIYSTGLLGFTGAFQNVSLKTLEFNSQLIRSGVNQFHSMPLVRKIVFPETINDITVFYVGGCFALEEITFPASNSLNIDISYLVSNSIHIKKITFSQTWDNHVVNPYSAFRGLAILTEIVNMPKFKNGLAGYMFDGCRTIKKLKCAITAQTGTTDLQYAFNNCYMLEEIEEFPSLPNITNIIYMFQSCYKLSKINNLDTLGDTTTGMDLTYTYNSCYSLNPIGGLRVRNKITGRFCLYGNATTRASLQALLFTNPNPVSTWAGASPQIDISQCNMDADALNALFTSVIATSVSFSGKTIRITGNPGAATCDTTIITNAGGTVNKTT